MEVRQLDATKIEFQRKRFKRLQTRTLVVLYFFYMSAHASRTGYSYSAKYIQNQTHENNEWLGWVSMTFLLCYGFGLSLSS